MNNLVTVNLKQEALDFPGRKELLLSGKCSALMPLNMVTDGNMERGVYNISSYRKISSMRHVSAWEILDITEKTLECVELCKDFLLFPDEYVLSADTIYISEDTGQAGLIYIPAEKNCSAEKVVSLFIYSLKKITTENGSTYLDTIGKLIECGNLKYHRVIAFIEELKREVKLYEII